jgi:hypothetical protein
LKIFIKTTLSSAVTALLLAAICLAQTSQPGSSASQEPSVTAKNQPNGAAGSGTSLLPAGSTLQAELIAPVDARKNKAGDEVLAKLTHDVKASGNVVIPKGSRVVGHVTEVKSRSKDQPSSKVGVVFDRVVLKNGGEVAVAMRIQAIGRALPAGEGELASGTTSVAPGGLLGGIGSTTTGGANDIGHTAPSTSLALSSQGVVGLHGLSLSNQNSPSQTATPAQVSVISSNSGNVHLDSGTEMILRVSH